MANMDKSTETGNNKTQSAVVAALVIGLLVGFFIGRSWGQTPEDEDVDNGIKVEETASTTKDADVSVKTDTTKADDTKNTTLVAAPVTTTTGTLAVTDQSAGSIVMVSKVTLSETGWVVVREDTGTGMGNILGAQWLPAGTHENVAVDLLRKTESNKNYFVVLHGDNGDKKFDKAADAEIMVGGKAVSGIFSAK